MEKRGFKEWVVRMLLLCAGLTIAHFGVTLFILVDLGADPFNVLVQGLSRHLPISHGVTHMGVCLLIILVLLDIDRSYVKLGTFACMVLGGPIIDFFTWLLGGVVNAALPMPVRVIVVMLGCIILAFGMTIVIRSDAGTGPNDLVAVALVDKLHRRFSVVRIIVDCLFVLTGVILGGTFGVGTLVCAFLVGITAGFCMPMSEKIVNKIIRKLMR